jgi:2',3'-cyclic-nucleotide 3'-phosphodiesterase
MSSVAQLQHQFSKSNEMPGSSLWLLPPKAHPLNSILSTLINQTSLRFGSAHRFLPHVTITSEISPSQYSSDPQAWLDSLKLPPGGEVEVKFEKLASEDVFVRKLYIKCNLAAGLKHLVMVCRREVEGFGNEEEAAKWTSEKYNPHLSLLYHDCPPVDAEGLAEVENLVEKAGVKLAEECNLDGWKGGRVVLVPTDEPIRQWSPLAEREL